MSDPVRGEFVACEGERWTYEHHRSGVVWLRRHGTTERARGLAVVQSRGAWIVDGGTKTAASTLEGALRAWVEQVAPTGASVTPLAGRGVRLFGETGSKEGKKR